MTFEGPVFKHILSNRVLCLAGIRAIFKFDCFVHQVDIISYLSILEKQKDLCMNSKLIEKQTD